MSPRKRGPHEKRLKDNLVWHANSTGVIFIDLPKF